MEKFETSSSIQAVVGTGLTMDLGEARDDTRKETEKCNGLRAIVGKL